MSLDSDMSRPEVKHPLTAADKPLNKSPGANEAPRTLATLYQSLKNMPFDKKHQVKMDKVVVTAIKLFVEAEKLEGHHLEAQHDLQMVIRQMERLTSGKASDGVPQINWNQIVTGLKALAYSKNAELDEDERRPAPQVKRTWKDPQIRSTVQGVLDELPDWIVEAIVEEFDDFRELLFHPSLQKVNRAKVTGMVVAKLINEFPASGNFDQYKELIIKYNLQNKIKELQFSENDHNLDRALKWAAQNLKQLQRLKISRSSGLTSAGLNDIASLSGLKKLSIKDVQIGDSD